MVLIRDYGINDHSMIRFEPGHKLADNFYARQDGTRTFFFTLDYLDKLFTGPVVKDSQSLDNDHDNKQETSTPTTLFERSVNEYVFRETVNIKENLRVPRVFIQSKFIRTDTLI